MNLIGGFNNVVDADKKQPRLTAEEIQALQNVNQDKQSSSQLLTQPELQQPQQQQQTKQRKGDGDKVD